MREFIDIIELMEGDVINLQSHKTEKAVDDYVNVIRDMYKGEKDFFAGGKFVPFAQSYIDSQFDPKFKPWIEITVHARDYKLSPEVKALFVGLRAQRFKYESATKWAKGYRPKAGTVNYALGPWATKQIDFNTARELFANREHSPYGVYQKSSSGFRSTYEYTWNEFGVGFNIVVGGYDSRRGEYPREEYHIIDDDKDMKEVSEMFAMINRARIALVKN